MKKLLALLLSLMVLPVSGYAAITHFTETLPPAQTAGCTPVSNGYDWGLTCDSPAQAETFNGTTTVNTTLIFGSQQQATQLSSSSVVLPNKVFIILSSTGNNITMAGAGTVNSGPISTASATNGQWLILTSTSNGTNGSITLSSGVASGLDLGSATRVLAWGKILGLMYNSLQLQWVEMFYGNN